MTFCVVRLLKPSRAFGWALILLGLAWANLRAAELEVRFEPPQKGEKLHVQVTGLSRADLTRLRARPESDLPAILAVRIDGAKSAMLGTYRIDERSLRFESRFPGSPGLTYRADFDPARIPIAGDAKPISATVRIPKPAIVATTELMKIFPTRDHLPENQLKFYLHFSAPMSRANAYSHIHLIDDKGREVANPFLELGEELWDADTKRFTLFLHPGRIKRGLKMREELGPILEEGRRYTLVIDEAWPDAEENPLKKGFRKAFSVGKPDDTQPSPKDWTLKLPAGNNVEPLTVDFPEPLDHALLNRVIWVEDSNGKRIAGATRISREETRWQFTPEKPWKGGKYRLVVETILEDLAGNSIARPFEVDIVQPLPHPNRAKTVSRAFEIK